MKTTFSLITLLLTCIISNAQFSKGTHLVNLNFAGYLNSHSETNYIDTSLPYTTNYYYNNDYNNSNISFTPAYGFFTKENLLISVGPTYSYEHYKNKSVQNDINNVQVNHYETNETTNYYGVQISIEKFHTLTEKLFWDYYINAGYSYGSGTVEQVYDSYNNLNFKVTADRINILAGAGFAYLLSDSWLINAGIGSLGWSAGWKTRTKSNSDETGSESNDSQIRFNALYFSLGISMILK